MERLNIRTYTWLKDNLSWAYVFEQLMNSFERLGHNTYIVSTNGYNEKAFSKNKMSESLLKLTEFGLGKKAIDIDITYTVPVNFNQRFLPNSKNKCAIYNYETTFWPKDWAKYYGLVDYYFPSSNFSAEIFIKNKVPREKIFVIPHGVDTKVFNKDVPKLKVNSQKKFKFISVVAPHARKNIPALIKAYCEAFTAKDDVCLIIKSKLYTENHGLFSKDNPNGRHTFEVCVGSIINDITKKYGVNAPEIELVTAHVDNVASIYNIGQCHVTTTGSECFYMPGLESMACGLLNIAPRYSGHLDFLTDSNSLLINTSTRYATKEEQYWGYDKRGKIGAVSISHTAELMVKAAKEHDSLINKFRPEMDYYVNKLTWEYAAQLIIDSVQKTNPAYVGGTYNIWP